MLHKFALQAYKLFLLCLWGSKKRTAEAKQQHEAKKRRRFAKIAKIPKETVTLGQFTSF